MATALALWAAIMLFVAVYLQVKPWAPLIDRVWTSPSLCVYSILFGLVAVAWGCARFAPASARPVGPANSARGHFFHRSSLRVEIPSVAIPSGRVEFIHEWGLPLVSMRSESFNASHVILPWRPLWPGFAINTVFYATLLWLLIPGPFALRRFKRLRRGLCPKCAYPMGESAVCTECGGALR